MKDGWTTVRPILRSSVRGSRAREVSHHFFLRTIDEIYVDDPKKAFNSNWESIAQVVHENQEWKREMRHVSSRKKFVEEMINIKTGFLCNLYK